MNPNNPKTTKNAKVCIVKGTDPKGIVIHEQTTIIAAISAVEIILYVCFARKKITPSYEVILTQLHQIVNHNDFQGDNQNNSSLS